MDIQIHIADPKLHMKDFESGQMGLKTVKWAYSGVHLSQTMWSHARNQ